jgi:hypothetical protein
MLPESELIGMSLTQYKDFLAKNPPAPSSDNDAAMVRRVGTKIQSAVTKYMAQQKLSDRISGYKWEFNLVNDPTVNA